MTRRLLNLLTAFSLVLCVAIGAVWVRSCFISDQFRTQFLQINADAGFLGWTVLHDYQSLSTELEAIEWTAGTDPDYFPAGTLPDPDRRQRYESLERRWWDVRSTRDYPLLRVQEGSYILEEGYRREDPDPPDIGGVPNPFVAYRVPYWPLILLTALLPAVDAVTGVLRRWRARARSARGRCRRCGYDLRATPDKCPECGQSSAAGGLSA